MTLVKELNEWACLRCAEVIEDENFEKFLAEFPHYCRNGTTSQPQIFSCGICKTNANVHAQVVLHFCKNDRILCDRCFRNLKKK